MAPNQKHTKRTKQFSSSKSQVSRKPAESIQSEVFKMKRTFIRTFSAIDQIIKQKFGNNIIDIANDLDAPTKEKLQSSNINELFNQLDNNIGSIIQPPKPVTTNPLSKQKESETMIMTKQQFLIGELEAKLEKLNAEMSAVKKAKDEQDENDLLDKMTTEE